MGPDPSAEAESKKIVEEASKFIDGSSLDYEVYRSLWLDEFRDYVNDPKNIPAKLPDFIDRMDLVIRIPPVAEVLLGKDGALKELMDVASMIIKKNFGDIGKVEQRALVALAHVLLTSNSRRSAEVVIFGADPQEPNKFQFSDFRPSDRRVLDRQMQEFEADVRNEALSGFYLI